jgi:DEAD/DEAH box helicase domain-containing protein
MCEPRDIGQALGDKSPETVASAHRPVPFAAEPPSARRPHFDPTLFLFDHIPGGVGLAERIFEMATTLLERTRTMIAGCACDSGCPGCVGPADQPNVGGRKLTALRLLGRMVASQTEPL